MNTGYPVPRAVIFDLDDTLFPERSYVNSGMNAVIDYLIQKENVSLSLEQLSTKIVSLLESDRNGVFNRLLSEIGLYSPLKVNVLVNIYRTHTPSICLFDDVKTTISKLRQQSVKCGVLTDGISVVQHQKISALHLQELVDVVLCTDDIPGNHRKPSVLPYQMVLSYLSVLPADTIYIGDDMSKDFIGAKEIGIKTIRIDRQLPFPLNHRTNYTAEYRPDKTVTNLHDAIKWWSAQ